MQETPSGRNSFVFVALPSLAKLGMSTKPSLGIPIARWLSSGRTCGYDEERVALVPSNKV